jgi:SET domain-containing protein
MKIRKRNADGADLSAVEVRQSDVHGRGVFSLRNLRPGEVIGHYAGRRYGPDETHPGWNDQLTYLFGLSDGSVIDDAEGGNATRHINHAYRTSKQSNAEAPMTSCCLWFGRFACFAPATNCSWTTRS